MIKIIFMSLPSYNFIDLVLTPSIVALHNVGVGWMPEFYRLQLSALNIFWTLQDYCWMFDISEKSIYEDVSQVCWKPTMYENNQFKSWNKPIDSNTNMPECKVFQTKIDLEKMGMQVSSSWIIFDMQHGNVWWRKIVGLLIFFMFDPLGLSRTYSEYQNRYIRGHFASFLNVQFFPFEKLMLFPYFAFVSICTYFSISVLGRQDTPFDLGTSFLGWGVLRNMRNTFYGLSTGHIFILLNVILG